MTALSDRVKEAIARFDAANAVGSHKKILKARNSDHLGGTMQQYRRQKADDEA